MSNSGGFFSSGYDDDAVVTAAVDHGADILTAFLDRLQAFATAKGLPVAYPGVHFTPPDAGMWLEAAWFPNETRNLVLGNDGSQLRGFGQVSCCARPGSGILPVANLSGEVISHYAKGVLLGVATVEKKPWASSVLIGDERISVPVTVPYAGVVTE